MAGSPAVLWYTSDFLNGVADLEDSEIGIYTIVLTLMADQGRPIDDDPRWIARRAGSTTRRVNKCLDRLEASGKIERKNGLIGNEKMLQVIRKRATKSEQAARAADAKWAQWRQEHRPTLPFVEDPDEQNSQKNWQKKSRKNGKKLREKTQKNSAVKNDDPQNSAENALQTHADSRACAIPNQESNKQTTDTKPKESARAEKENDRPLDGDRDLVRLLETVSNTAGFIPRGTTGHVNAIDQVREWRDAGIDFSTTVIPTIERIVAGSSDPTSSLRRFDKAIRHEHAKSRAAKNLPSGPPKPTPKPILKFDDEQDDHTELRKTLAEKIPEFVYSRLLNHTRFVTIDRHGKRILSVEIRNGFPLDAHEVQALVRSPARRAGWHDVW